MIWLHRACAVAFCLGLVALTPAPTEAGNCVRQRQVVKHQRVRVVQHHAQYQAQNVRHAYQHQKYVAPVKAVVQYDYYYSVSDAYRDSLLADALAYRLLNAQAQLRAAQQFNKHVPRYSDPAAAQPAPRAQPKSQPQPGQGQAGLVPDGLAKVVEAHCIKCHAGGKNGINLDDLAAVPEKLRLKSFHLVNKGKMPKGKPALSDEENKLFDEWAEMASK